MNKILTAALAGLLLAAPLRAEDAKPAPGAKDSIMTFFKHLKDSLSQSAVQSERKKGRRAGAVAAVRGADQSSSVGDPNEPAIKGDARSKREKAQRAEDAEFAKGVDLVLNGKTEQGVKALEEFKAKHPKSHNLSKVQEAIDQAKALTIQPSAPPAQSAAAAPAPKGETPAADSK